jgi:hypothetical protein
MSKVYDVFTFSNELDVLECRLAELADHVHRFVIVEGTHTHQGAKRETVFDKHARRFRYFAPKLNHIVADLSDPNALPATGSTWKDSDHWNRFLIQEEAGLRGMEDAEDGDVVIFGDVDEIPRREMTLVRPGAGEVVALGMRHHVYGFNWLHPEQWVGTGITRAAHARKIGLHRVRSTRPLAKVIPDAGWHLSWFGGAAACREKIDSFTHPELAEMKPALEWCIKHGIAYTGRKLWPVKFDPQHPEDFPAYVRSGVDMRSHWLA